MAEAAGIIDFQRRWHRLGGGAAHDIWDRFGLAPGEYFSQLLDALDDAAASPGEGSAKSETLDEATVFAIRSVARRRLWLAA